jgi:hypothetical protein
MLALSPGAWAARRQDDTSAQRGVLHGGLNPQAFR